MLFCHRSFVATATGHGTAVIGSLKGVGLWSLQRPLICKKDPDAFKASVPHLCGGRGGQNVLPAPRAPWARAPYRAAQGGGPSCLRPQHNSQVPWAEPGLDSRAEGGGLGLVGPEDPPAPALLLKEAVQVCAKQAGSPCLPLQSPRPSRRCCLRYPERPEAWWGGGRGLAGLVR